MEEPKIRLTPEVEEAIDLFKEAAKSFRESREGKIWNAENEDFLNDEDEESLVDTNAPVVKEFIDKMANVMEIVGENELPITGDQLKDELKNILFGKGE